MNARSTSFEFTCLGKRVNEIVSAIIHSVIFNRCFGKFRYELESSFSIGTLGFEEVVCDFIDFTYIRVGSSELLRQVNREIKEFVDQLRTLASASSSSNIRPGGLSKPGGSYQAAKARQYLQYNEPIISTNFGESGHDEIALPLSAYTAATGTISLEFFIKSSNSWAFSEPLIWEVWTLKINCLKEETNERQFNKSSIEDQLLDKMLSIVQLINNNRSYLPQMPSQSEVDNVFDTGYSDVQPYNFKIKYKVGGGSSTSGGSSSSDSRTLSDKNSTQHVIKKFIKQKLAL